MGTTFQNTSVHYSNIYLAIRLLACLFVGIIGTPTIAANTQSVFTYESSVPLTGGSPLDLKAELNYNNSLTNAPIAVVMHGYSPATGNFGNVRANAQRLRDAGFFAVSVAMRGRDDSEGTRDSGGLEIYDIYDAVEAVKAQFPNLVDPTNIHITGYSGGGGNVMSALTKFPDYFRLGSSFFGMSDYGYNQTSGWYQEGAASNHQLQMRTDIGNPLTGGAAVLDKYMARASNLASHNNPYSEIHLFVNDNEPTCPPINITTYRDNAVANASEAGEFDNIHIHIGTPSSPTYQDFDGDSVNDANELQSWPHGFPTANQQAAGEGWYLNRLLSGSIPQPVLHESDTLFVAGFVKTKPFELRLGDGQNAAGTLEYDLTGNQKQFDLEIESSNQSATGTLWVNTADTAGKTIDVLLNGVFTQSFVGGGVQEFNGFGHGDTLLLSVHLLGDYNRDTMVDQDDFLAWRTSFGTSGNLSADGNGDGAINAADYVVWRDGKTVAMGASFVTAVPEPAGAWMMLLLAAWAAKKVI